MTLHLPHTSKAENAVNDHAQEQQAQLLREAIDKQHSKQPIDIPGVKPRELYASLRRDGVEDAEAREIAGWFRDKCPECGTVMRHIGCDCYQCGLCGHQEFPEGFDGEVAAQTRAAQRAEIRSEREMTRFGAFDAIPAVMAVAIILWSLGMMGLWLLHMAVRAVVR